MYLCTSVGPIKQILGKQRHLVSHLTSYELLDESLVRVGASLLVSRRKGHLLETDYGTREQTKHTHMPLNETKNLITENKLDESDSDQDVHIIAKFFGSRVFLKVE